MVKRPELLGTSTRRDPESELQESEDRFRAAFDFAAIGMALVAPDGRWLRVNQSLCRILDYSPEELLAIDFQRITHPDDLDKDLDFLRQMLARTRQYYEMEKRYFHKNGSILWVLLSVSLVWRDGQPLYFISQIQDITVRKDFERQLRETQTDLEAVMNHVPAMIGYWHKDSTNRFANRAYEETFGVAAGGMQGRHMQDILGEETFAVSAPYIDAALAGEPQSFERSTLRADGSAQHTHAQYVPDVRNGEVLGLYVLAIDITELHDSRERVRALAQRLESVREEERKDLALLLHEGIAQDLFVTKLSVDYLKTQARGRAGVSEACAELTLQIEMMLEQIRRISNELRPDGFVHSPLLTSLDHHLKTLGKHAGLRVEVSEVAPFPILPEAVRVIFFRAAQEALQNVIRHANATTVAITLSATAERISMTVEDDGVGITELDLLKPGSLGLVGIEERFKSLGGGTIVSNAQPTGAVLMAYVPAVASTPG